MMPAFRASEMLMTSSTNWVVLSAFAFFSCCSSCFIVARPTRIAFRKFEADARDCSFVSRIFFGLFRASGERSTLPIIVVSSGIGPFVSWLGVKNDEHMVRFGTTKEQSIWSFCKTDANRMLPSTQFACSVIYRFIWKSYMLQRIVRVWIDLGCLLYRCISFLFAQGRTKLKILPLRLPEDCLGILQTV